VSVVAYRIIQESLTNVIRHSTAKHAIVRLDRNGHRLRVSVIDHGPARASSTVTPAGFGIAGMTARARAVGGELSAGPGESGGFEVWASLPLPKIWRVPS
jgi:signal transduction histidine kinase